MKVTYCPIVSANPNAHFCDDPTVETYEPLVFWTKTSTHYVCRYTQCFNSQKMYCKKRYWKCTTYNIGSHCKMFSYRERMYFVIWNQSVKTFNPHDCTMQETTIDLHNVHPCKYLSAGDYIVEQSTYFGDRPYITVIWRGLFESIEYSLTSGYMWVDGHLEHAMFGSIEWACGDGDNIYVMPVRGQLRHIDMATRIVTPLYVKSDQAVTLNGDFRPILRSEVACEGVSLGTKYIVTDGKIVTYGFMKPRRIIEIHNPSFRRPPPQTMLTLMQLCKRRIVTAADQEGLEQQMAKMLPHDLLVYIAS